MTLSFTVLGTPQPQGSAKGFVYRDKRTGAHRAAITSDNPKLRPWRQDVAWTAKEAMLKAGITAPTEEAVRVTVLFVFPKPKSTARAVGYKITKPDVDKLLRGLLDALTGIVFRDDSQVISAHCSKCFGEPECRIEISVIPVRI